MASVKWSKEAVTDLDAIDSTISRKIIAKISWLAENFEYLIPETLHYELKDIFKLRVGDYRVLYQISEGTIIIQMIGHRSRIYKRFRP